MVKSGSFRAQGAQETEAERREQGASEKSRSEYGKVSKKLPEQESSGRELQKGTSACAATQRMVNPLLAGGYEAAGHQTFRKTDLA